jgi:hypothetical protein
MKKINYLIFFLFIQSTVLGQNYLFKIAQEPIKNYVQFENQRGSTQRKYPGYFGGSTGWFKLGQPFQFIKTDIGFNPPAVIEYMFSIPDSIVREIHFEIDTNNFSQSGSYLEKNERLKGFNNQYSKLLADLILFLGPPKDSSALRQLSNEDWKRDAKWDNDSLKATLYLSFTNEKNGEGQTRVRMGIYFKNPNPPKNDFGMEEVTASPTQDGLSQKFISCLLKKDFKTAWDMLDTTVQKSVTYDQFVEYLKPIPDFKKKLGKEISLFGTSKMSGMGVSYIVYMYGFKKDKERVPSVLINVSFNDLESKKIVGIRYNSKIGTTK